MSVLNGGRFLTQKETAHWMTCTTTERDAWVKDIVDELHRRRRETLRKKRPKEAEELRVGLASR